MKFFSKSDDKFVGATKSAELRAELIKLTSQFRILGSLIVLIGGSHLLLSVMAKETHHVMPCFIILFGMLVWQNADQQIKIMKCFAVNKQEEKHNK